MKIKKEKVQEVKTERFNDWVMMVQDEQTFKDKKWRAAIGRQLLPEEPKETARELREALEKWPMIHQIEKLAWFTTLITEANKTTKTKEQ